MTLGALWMIVTSDEKTMETAGGGPCHKAHQNKGYFVS